MKEPVSSVKPGIHAFLGQFFDAYELSDDEDIFATGFVNSMFAMQLVQFVEGKFGITVDSEDLELDNFRSVSSLASFVERKQAAPSAAG